MWKLKQNNCKPNRTHANSYPIPTCTQRKQGAQLPQRERTSNSTLSHGAKDGQTLQTKAIAHTYTADKSISIKIKGVDWLSGVLNAQRSYYAIQSK